uniref:BTB domain-containing protein n=1 Tax=Stomoxys calcitrans TaxID=35570 RepID=A0A1I8PHG7_STOCA
MSVYEAEKDKNYPDKMQAFVDLGMAVDCRFLIGPDAANAQEIDGHKIIFASESPVFKSMLFGDFKEKTALLEIPIPADNFKDFKHMRLLLYSVDRNALLELMRISDVIALYCICDKYLMESFTDLLIDYMKSHLAKASNEDKIYILKFADEFQKTNLMNCTWKHILKGRGSITFGNTNILKPHLFVDLIRQVSSLVRGDDLFRAIGKYLEHHNLMPTNILDAKNAKGDEKLKHEIWESLMFWTVERDFRCYQIQPKRICKADLITYGDTLKSKYGF